MVLVVTLLCPSLLCLVAVDGQWQEWSPWSQCSVTCSNGTQQRSRQCTAAAHGGSECRGPWAESRECYNPECTGKYPPALCLEEEVKGWACLLLWVQLLAHGHALTPPQAPVGCGGWSSLPRRRTGACLLFNLMSHLEIKRVHLQKAAWQGLHACFSVLLPFKGHTRNKELFED